ncbi:MAG: Abi family protein [Clostridia bacterium]|nr:Abi family protein [Clostridia bacterium]
MSKTDKPLLNSSQQIAHLKSKGVLFNLMSEQDAEQYLRQNNNYFKLRAYRKNFAKYDSGPRAGQYIKLDFAMLRDLSIIDMRLRYVIIHLCLDVEHFIKVKMLRVTEAQGEDGYDIVADYMNHLMAQEQSDPSGVKKPYAKLVRELERNNGNPYCGGIINSYSNGFPIWAFIEVIPLGSLIDFYGFCADRFSMIDMKREFYLLQTIRQLRNAAAHSNCILYDMTAADAIAKPDWNMIRKLSTIPKSTRDKRFGNERMRQLVTLLYLHSEVVTSQGVHDRAKQQLTELLSRMYHHIEYYRSHPIVTSNFDFFKKCVDIFFTV